MRPVAQAEAHERVWREIDGRAVHLDAEARAGDRRRQGCLGRRAPRGTHRHGQAVDDPLAARVDPRREGPSLGKHHVPEDRLLVRDRKSTRLNSSHSQISYAVFCLKKKKHKRAHYNMYSIVTHVWYMHDTP